MSTIYYSIVRVFIEVFNCMFKGKHTLLKKIDNFEFDFTYS